MSQFQEVEVDEMRAVLDVYRQSPEAERHRRAMAKQKAEKRAALIAQLTAAQEKGAAAAEKLADEKRALLAKRDKALASMRELQAELNNMAMCCSSLSSTTFNTVATIRRDLDALCPPTVSALLAEFHDLMAETARVGIEAYEVEVPLEDNPLYTRKFTTNNGEAFRRRVGYLRDAINRDIPELAYATDAEIEEAARDLRAAVPPCKGVWDIQPPGMAARAVASVTSTVRGMFSGNA